MDELKHVSVPVKVKFDEGFNSDKFIKLSLTFAHDGINPNHSRFTIGDLTGHKDSLFLSPLLGNIIQDEDGNYAFGKHDMEFRPNPFKDNQMQLYYLENIIGIIPQEELANFSTAVIDGRNYVTVNGFLYKGYSNFAEDIIAQYDAVPISMEIDVFKYTFDVKDNVYDITDFAYTGITFLNQECGTGMIGANAKFFSQSEFHTQMFTMVQELKQSIADQFSELCNKNNKNGGNDILENNTNANIVAESDTTNIQFNQNEVSVNEPKAPVTESETFDNAEVPVVSEPKPTIEPDKFVKSFELSHDDIRYGLYTLLVPIEEQNNEWYYIEAVYDTYFDYVNELDKHFRQTYSKTDTGVSFDGDRIDIFVERLTSGEKSALDMLRNNYSAEHTELEELRTFKSNYDASVVEAKRQEVFEKWGTLIGEDNETYTALKSDYSAFSPEELETKCKCIFADVKAVIPTTFAANTNKKEKEFTPVVIGISDAPTTENTNEPYGGLFKEFN